MWLTILAWGGMEREAWGVIELPSPCPLRVGEGAVEREPWSGPADCSGREQERGQAGQEGDGADDGGGYGSQKHGAGGDVQGSLDARSQRGVETADERFDGAIKQLGRQDEPDTPQEQAPFDGAATEDECGG